MGFGHTNFSAATAAVTNRFVTSANMKVATAYTLANAGAMPTAGARLVTCTRTVAGNADTPGTILVTGTDLLGNTITDTLTVGAHTVLVTGTKYFASVASVQGSGWVIDAGTSTNDTIVVGCAAAAIVAQGTGTLVSVIVNTTAAGTIILADSSGTIATLKASIGEGVYPFLVNFSGYLSVTLGAASDVTLVHTGSMPSSYAM